MRNWYNIRISKERQLHAVDYMEKKQECDVKKTPILEDYFNPIHHGNIVQSEDNITITNPDVNVQAPSLLSQGVVIEPNITESKRQDTLTHHLKQTDVYKLASLLNQVAQEIIEENPGIGPYMLFHMMGEYLPYHIPKEVFSVAIQAFSSRDTNTRRAGKEAFLYLSSKTITSAIDTLISSIGSEGNNRDDLAKSALLYVAQVPGELRSKVPITKQIYEHAKKGSLEYITSEGDIPLEVIKSPRYREAQLLIKSVHHPDSQCFTQSDFDALLFALVEMMPTVNEQTLRNYLLSKTTIHKSTFDENILVDANTSSDRIDQLVTRETIHRAVDQLPPNWAQTIVMRYLNGDIHPYKTIADKLGVSTETVRAYDRKALGKLRFRQRKILRDIVQDSPSDSSPVKRQPSIFDRNNVPPNDNLYYYVSISVPQADIKFLAQNGLKKIGDLFSARPYEIRQEWVGSLESLMQITDIVLQRTSPLLKDIQNFTQGEYSLLTHISDAIIYRDPKSALASLLKDTRTLIGIQRGDYRREDLDPISREVFDSLTDNQRAEIAGRGRQRIVAIAYEELHNAFKRQFVPTLFERKQYESQNTISFPLLPGVSLKPTCLSRIHNHSIKELGLSIRTYNALMRTGLTDICSVLDTPSERLLSIRSFGDKSYQEVLASLSSYLNIHFDIDNLENIAGE